MPATVVQSLKAEAYASAIQIHTAVRADIQGPKAGVPAQRGSTANEAPTDQRSPLSQWPPSTVDACRMSPLTSTGLTNGSEQILSVNQGSRTIPKQGIAATTGPTAGIPRNHPHRALHPARPAGRNQCSTALRTLHYHERLGQGHQPTVPRREVPWAHTATGPTRTDQQPLPACLLYTSPSPRDQRGSRMPSSA